MPIASRTPEGWPNRCPVCGASLHIDPSLPPGDAPCPQCGHLVWFDPEDLRKRVLEKIAAILHTDPAMIDLDSPLEALATDSLDVVELIMELEEEFEFSPPAEGLPSDSIRTVRDLIEWIVRGIEDLRKGD